MRRSVSAPFGLLVLMRLASKGGGGARRQVAACRICILNKPCAFRKAGGRSPGGPRECRFAQEGLRRTTDEIMREHQLPWKPTDLFPGRFGPARDRPCLGANSRHCRHRPCSILESGPVDGSPGRVRCRADYAEGDWRLPWSNQSTFAASAGLAMCSAKPASSARWRSSGRAYPLTAMS